MRIRALPKGLLLIFVNTGAFWVPLIVAECFYRQKLTKMTAFNKPRPSMTQEEFNKLVSEGRKLVILDELVLDVGSFISRHPGGRFALK